ncbi:MAG: AI-2E family transporter [Candidatus Wolfebacteria bacterium]|nr:AI-2E family transporter [Candidatus Wolfebacteria bacterium]
MKIFNGANGRKPQVYFLLAILAGIFVLVFFIFRPFLYALVLAMVFATVLHPVYQKIVGLTRGRQGIAALAAILIVVALIFTPLIFLGVQIFQEAQQLYFSLAEGGGKNAVFNIFNNLLNSFQNYFPGAQEFSLTIDQYLKQGLSWLLQHLGSVFGSFAKMAVSSFLFLFALYYLLKDGQKLKAAIIALSPLSNTDNEAIFQKLKMAVDSVVKGNLLIALAQGVSTAAGFAIFGIPKAVLWGSVAAIAALIPGIGTALVLTPAILFLFLKGEIFSGAGLIVWGVTAVGLVDNFLGPKLVGRGMQLHPLIILLSVLGGIGFFGPIGFLLGPLTISLLFALLDTYSSLRMKKNL